MVNHAYESFVVKYVRRFALSYIWCWTTNTFMGLSNGISLIFFRGHTRDSFDGRSKMSLTFVCYLWVEKVYSYLLIDEIIDKLQLIEMGPSGLWGIRLVCLTQPLIISLNSDGPIPYCKMAVFQISQNNNFHLCWKTSLDVLVWLPGVLDVVWGSWRLSSSEIWVWRQVLSGLGFQFSLPDRPLIVNFFFLIHHSAWQYTLT